MNHTYLHTSLLGLLSMTTLSCKETPKEPDMPNVVFIYADDMGRGMLSHFRTGPC